MPSLKKSARISALGVSSASIDRACRNAMKSVSYWSRSSGKVSICCFRISRAIMGLTLWWLGNLTWFWINCSKFLMNKRWGCDRVWVRTIDLYENGEKSILQFLSSIVPHCVSIHFLNWFQDWLILRGGWGRWLRRDGWGWDEDEFIDGFQRSNNRRFSMMFLLIFHVVDRPF